MTKFYDTCTLLQLQEDVFATDEIFYISNITLSELENIKTSGTKDEEIRWKARKLLHLLENNKEKYNTIIYNTNTEDKIIEKFGLILNNDSRIIAQVYNLIDNNNEIEFHTADLACASVAVSIEIPTVYTMDIIEEEYTGFKIITFESESQLAFFYSHTLVENTNVYDLLDNEYLLIKFEDKIIDQYRYFKNSYYKIGFQKEESQMFGKIIAKDVYQQIAMDSLANNQVTMLRGRAGSGKSYIAFGYMFSLLEQGKIDKIIVFCNTVATKGSARLGFYPGTRTEKLLDSQIGNLLVSKLGDRCAVERLIDEGKLILLPLSDLRGFDTTGMNAAVYISEAQNLDIELMRLALQRIGEDSVCIIDGDFCHQVDMSIYAGSANGMRRVSQIFRGNDCYGEVELQNIYRSKIAEIAEKL